ncbi:terminase large subunit [Anaerobutyricum hallii]|jgi:phage terminase large subunit-like protein|uniref:Terminase large subunit n=1 Tax=Anaerobutyricum hallii TaxID=39488 RepID=A0A414B844_9FIRM|nr:terminase large subunit [Anaerobutyricum hallii]RHC66961.1 terminase large subunit [Anaerobutyricum hallii]
MAESKLFKEVKKYARDIVSGEIIANEDRVLAAKRFLKDLDNTAYEMRTRDADFVIKIIEATFVHIKGPARGKAFLLEPWEKFICYNVAGFYIAGTEERRFKEAFIFLPRKNSKTFFASALAWALSLLERQYFSVLYIIATKLDRAMEAFENIRENIEYMGESKNFKILNNNAEHSISRTFYDENENKSGALRIQALAADAKRADGLNANIIILDEMHAYKNANEYYVYKQAMKAYVNKLLIGITTAGSDMNSFCYQRLQYCKEVMRGTKVDEEYFIFICQADNPDDYTNPVEHEKANPNYGVTIREKDILNEALQAQNDPTGRDEFLNKSLNIYTNALNTYFDIFQAQESDKQFSWTLEELAHLPIKWYGGADLSKMYDLTGTALHGRYKNTDICISHGFMPVTAAHLKAEEDQIPFFWWEEQDWLTLCNSDVIEYEDVLKWFLQMRKIGFDIKWVGYDRRYSREFVLKMKKSGFKMRDQSQRYVEKTEAFREIEKKLKKGEFYYLHNKAFEYCLSNVKAIEDSDEFVRFEKVQPTYRIDLFDADVIACKQMLIDLEKSQKQGKWFG